MTSTNPKRAGECPNILLMAIFSQRNKAISDLAGIFPEFGVTICLQMPRPLNNSTRSGHPNSIESEYLGRPMGKPNSKWKWSEGARFHPHSTRKKKTRKEESTRPGEHQTN